MSKFNLVDALFGDKRLEELEAIRKAKEAEKWCNIIRANNGERELTKQEEAKENRDCFLGWCVIILVLTGPLLLGTISRDTDRYIKNGGNCYNGWYYDTQKGKCVK